MSSSGFTKQEVLDWLTSKTLGETMDMAISPTGGKVAAIKELRLYLHCSLKTAKEAVEYCYGNLGYAFRNNDVVTEALRKEPTAQFRIKTSIFHKDENANVPSTTKTPVYMGRIVGWRAFRLCGIENTLKPLSYRDATFSICGKTIDTAPEPDVNNLFGFWAFKNRSQIENYGLTIADFNKEVVFATISLSGTVIEHTDGWRASEIEILELFSKANNSMRRNIAHRLGWPGKVKKLSEGQHAFKANITNIPQEEV